RPVRSEPSPLDVLCRRGLTPADRALYGLGDPESAPAELAGVLGDARFRFEGVTCHRAWSPDGKLLAVPGGNSILLYDASGRLLRILDGHTARVFRTLFS